MARPNENLYTPEGIASYENIIDADQYSIPTGITPVLYKPQPDEEGRYPHDTLFNVLNKQIKEFDPNETQYDPVSLGTSKTQDIDEGYANIYRAVLSDIGEQDAIFSGLYPTLKKRIIDDYAVRLNGLHTHFIDNMPQGLENKEKMVLANTYNDYIRNVILPPIAESMNTYAHRQSVDASGDNLWSALATTTASLMEGAAIGLRDPEYLNMQETGEWFQGVADYLKERQKTFDPKTGQFTLSSEERRRDVGGFSVGPLDIPTFKDGYIFSAIAEGVMQQVVTTGLPMAGAAVGGAMGLSSGGPVGGLAGGLAGATLFSAPGYLVESGSWSEELTSNWKDTQKEAIWAKENDIYSPEEFRKKYQIDLGEGQEERFITADELTDPLIKDIVDNMSQLYALQSTGIEILTSVGGGLASWGLKEGMGALASKWVKSNMGQRMLANQAFKMVKKPLAPIGRTFPQVVQEGWTERTQEGLNISLMQPFLPEYKQLTAEQEERRLNEATFLGGIIGGGFSLTGQGYQAYKDSRDLSANLDKEASDDAKRFYEVQQLTDELKSKDGKELLFHNDVDLAVQIGMMADVTLQGKNGTIMGDILENVADDIGQIDKYHQARQRISISEVNAKKRNAKLLRTKKGKAMLKALGLNAIDFVDQLTLKDFKAIFPDEQAEVLDQIAEEIDLEKRAEEEAKLSQNYTSENNISDYSDERTKVNTKKDKVLLNKQEKLKSKIKALAKEKNKNPKKFTKKKKQELSKLVNEFNSIGEKIKKRKNVRDSVKTDGKGKKPVTENTPTAVTKLVNPHKWQVKTEGKLEFFKSTGRDLTLQVIGTGVKKNKDGVEETYYTVKMAHGVDKSYTIKNPESFDVFDSEIDKGWNKKMKKSFKPEWKQKKEDLKKQQKEDIKTKKEPVKEKTRDNVIGGIKTSEVKLSYDPKTKSSIASIKGKNIELTVDEKTDLIEIGELEKTSSLRGEDLKLAKIFKGEDLREKILLRLEKEQVEFSANIGTKPKRFLDSFNFDRIKNPAFKAVFDVIKDFIPGDLTIRSDGRIKVKGKYNRSKNEITINPKKMESEDALLYTVLHEVVHSASARIIQNYLDGKLDDSTDQYRAVKQLDDLFQLIKSQLTDKDKKGITDLKKLVKKLKKNGLTVTEKNVAKSLRSKFYGFSNLKEFVSELMVNEDFQQQLQKIKFSEDNRSLFRKFIDNLFGIFGVDSTSFDNIDAFVIAVRASFTVMQAQKQSDTIKATDSKITARKKVDKSVKDKVKKVKKIVIKGTPKDKNLESYSVTTEEELDSYLDGKYNDSDLELTDGDIDNVANNTHEDLTNPDDDQDWWSDEEDYDIGLIDWTKKSFGLLNRGSKNRVNKAFAFGFQQLIRKFNLPLSYWHDYKRNMSERLEGTLIADAFNEWAKDYEINLEETLDKVGIYAEQDWEIQFSNDFNDGALSDIADTMQDAWDATEEFLRQGIGLTETGKLEAGTKASNFYKMDSAFFDAIGVTPNKANAKAYYNLAITSKTPEAFLNAISQEEFIVSNKVYSDDGRTPIDKLSESPYQKMLLVRFWNSQQEINRTPTNRGPKQKGAVRSLFSIFFGPKPNRPAGFKFEFKGKKDRGSNWVVNNKGTVYKKFQKLYKNLPNKMRSRAAESLFEVGELMYTSITDMWRYNKPIIHENKKGEQELEFSLRQNGNHRIEGWQAFLRSAYKNNMVPLFVRGDGKLIPMVKVSEDAKRWSGRTASYWSRELESVPDNLKSKVKRDWIMGYIAYGKIEGSSKSNLEEVLEFFPPNKKGNIKNSIQRYNAAQIARHEAYKKIYGNDYWLHLSGHNIVHRAKIPFSEGVRSELMPDKKMVTFDTSVKLGADSKAKMTKVYEDGSRKDIDLVQKIDNQWQYIWDGSTWTSEINFVEDYVNHLGTNKRARRAKTAFYVGGNEGAILQKHQEFAWFLEDGVSSVEITDGNGDFVATIKRDESGFVNIYDKNNQMIDYLATPDETKAMTGKYANQFNETITIPGNSVTMIQFARENDKSLSKFFTQLLNYFPDFNFQQMVMDYFYDRDVKRKRSPMQSLNLLNNVVNNPSEMDQFKIGYVRATIDGVPLGISRNAMTGVGFHPSDAGTNENVVKNGILRTAIDFLGYGSKLDFRMDNMGDLNDNEIVLPYDHKIAKNIVKIMKSKGMTGEFSKADINAWLKQNPIEVLAVRSPVPSRFGYRVMRVKRLENIGDTFMVNPKIVKQVFEGDGDGDTASITFLTGKHKRLMKFLKDNQELTSGLGLSPSGQEIEIATMNGLADAMYQMSLGKSAVAMIGNMAKISGVLNTWFEKLEVDGRVIKMRKMQDTWHDPDMDKTVSMENLYRMYMQAAADHAKLLLLGPDYWNFSRKKLYSALFYYDDNKNETISDEHYSLIANEVISPMTKGLSVVGGKYAGNELSFKDHFDFGEEYFEWIKSRSNKIIQDKPNANASEYRITAMLDKHLEELGLDKKDKKTREYMKEARSLIQDMVVEGKLFGKEGAQHALEEISTSVYKQGIDNGWDGNAFRTPFGKAIALHQAVMTDVSNQWNKDIVDELMIESGMTQKEIDKMSNREKDIWGLKNINPLIAQAQKFAQNLSTELRQAIKDTDFEEDIDSYDQSFSSNQYQMNDRENAVIEGWVARLNQNNLSPAQRKLFTWAYLNDIVDSNKIKGSGSLRLNTAFPPTDPIDPRNSLLDPELMREYYQKWNTLNKDKDFIVPNTEDLGVLRKTTDYLKDEFEKRGCII